MIYGMSCSPRWVPPCVSFTYGLVKQRVCNAESLWSQKSNRSAPLRLVRSPLQRPTTLGLVTVSLRVSKSALKSPPIIKMSREPIPRLALRIWSRKSSRTRCRALDTGPYTAISAKPAVWLFPGIRTNSARPLFWVGTSLWNPAFPTCQLTLPITLPPLGPRL